MLFPQLRMLLICRENAATSASEEQEGNENRNGDGKRDGKSGESDEDGEGKVVEDVGGKVGTTED